jgi:hypothetical protein
MHSHLYAPMSMKTNMQEKAQEGSTGTICFGDCTVYIKKVGRDDKGLGRWSWILLGGTEEHNTHIIMAYNLCKNKNVNLGTSYQQQQGYFITKKNDLTCPLIMFCKNLIKQLKLWRAAGDRIILCMDHNKHAVDGALGNGLADRDGLDLHKAILDHTGVSRGATFFQGSKPINGLWISNNLDISSTCIMLFGYGLGNHQTFILDIS